MSEIVQIIFVFLVFINIIFYGLLIHRLKKEDQNLCEFSKNSGLAGIFHNVVKLYKPKTYLNL